MTNNKTRFKYSVEQIINLVITNTIPPYLFIFMLLELWLLADENLME